VGRFAPCRAAGGGGDQGETSATIRIDRPDHQRLHNEEQKAVLQRLGEGYERILRLGSIESEQDVAHAPAEAYGCSDPLDGNGKPRMWTPRRALSRLCAQIWSRLTKRLYDGFFAIVMQKGAWREPLIESLAPQAGNTILDFGSGSSWTAIPLAQSFPEVIFVGVEADQVSMERVMKEVAQRHIPNLRVLAAPASDRFPVNAGTFDKAVCVLTFHDLPPDQKLQLAREFRRVLRRGGTLHVADYDEPSRSGEQIALTLAAQISGYNAAGPHFDGSWTKFLTEAGLVGVRRQSSHSVGIGRISIVRARKP
jgi:ubiquinone/menaquinone biosynthesis C-methylase UbiE